MIKSPREKYMNDPEYNYLVNSLEQLIEQAKFTPSELREACILASNNYEMRHIRKTQIDPRIEDACAVLDEFISRGRKKIYR